MFVLPLSRPAHRTALTPVYNRAVDRLFEESFDRIFGGVRAHVRTPALDVSETDNAYTLTFEVPGVGREQLKVSVHGRRISVETVAAAASEKTEPADGAAAVEAKDSSRVLYRERAAAKYARTVSLPAEVDQASSQAKFDNGVLTLTLAKKVPTGATQLSIS